MKLKYLTVKTLDDGFMLPTQLCVGLVDEIGIVTIPEQKR